MSGQTLIFLYILVLPWVWNKWGKDVMVPHRPNSWILQCLFLSDVENCFRHVFFTKFSILHNYQIAGHPRYPVDLACVEQELKPNFMVVNYSLWVKIVRLYFLSENLCSVKSEDIIKCWSPSCYNLSGWIRLDQWLGNSVD